MTGPTQPRKKKVQGLFVSWETTIYLERAVQKRRKNNKARPAATAVLRKFTASLFRYLPSNVAPINESKYIPATPAKAAARLTPSTPDGTTISAAVMPAALPTLEMAPLAPISARRKFVINRGVPP